MQWGLINVCVPLQPVSGRPLPYSLSAHDKQLLLKGKSVIIRDPGDSLSKDRRKGRAKIIQDIAAPPYLCMEKILDFDNYSKMVSLLKKFDVYDHTALSNVGALPWLCHLVSCIIVLYHSLFFFTL